MSAKRRAGHAASPELATPDTIKRIRKPNTTTFFPDRETVATTQELGGKAIALLKKSTDKTNRLIITHFLDLPDRDEYPDYYQQVGLPMSLNMIEAKLDEGMYDTMEKFESDLKRMVQNAKDYNSSKSEIFDDAERIRKNLSNFMPRHNPAYQNPDYRAYPTPVPQSVIDEMDHGSSAPSNERTSAEPTKVKLVFNKNNRRRQSQAASVADEETPADLQGSMLELLDTLSEQENAINFEEKPPKRDIPHYYKVIERPTSINDVRKMVQKGAITDWPGFATEVRLIWSNAKEYNEPASEIFEMAEVLDTYFEGKLQEHGIPPRVSTRITLSQPKPKQLKLKMNSATPTPTISTATVDTDALRRQKEETNIALTRATRAASRSYTNGSTPAPIAHSALRRSMSISEAHAAQDPQVNGHATIPADNDLSRMPAMPLNLNTVPVSVMSIEPNHAPSTVVMNGGHVDYQHVQAVPRNVYTEPASPLDRLFRDPGKGIEDALIDSVTWMTHPSLPNDPKWKLTRYASATQTQTAYYTYLDHDHSYIRILPQLTAELHSRAGYKLAVSHSYKPIQPVPSMQAGEPPYFETGLRTGENAIAVDVLAALKPGEKKDYAPPQQQWDFERIMIYIYLRPKDD